jgi:hypothetical protein
LFLHGPSPAAGRAPRRIVKRRGRPRTCRTDERQARETRFPSRHSGAPLDVQRVSLAPAPSLRCEPNLQDRHCDALLLRNTAPYGPSSSAQRLPALDECKPSHDHLAAIDARACMMVMARSPRPDRREHQAKSVNTDKLQSCDNQHDAKRLEDHGWPPFDSKGRAGDPA